MLQCENEIEMLLAGIELGIGIWLGLAAISLMVIAFMYVIGLLGRFRAKLQNRDPEADRVRSRDTLWMSTLESNTTLCHPDSGRRVLLRTMIAWSELNDRELRSKELREDR